MAKTSSNASTGDKKTATAVAKAPAEKTIIIQPVSNLVFGDYSYLFCPTWNEAEKEMHEPAEDMEAIKKTTMSFTIPGLGMVLNLKNKNHKKLHDIILHHPPVMALFAEGSTSQLFRMLDPETDAEKYLESAENKMVVYGYVNDIVKKDNADIELTRTGRVFGISGSPKVIQAALLQAIEKPEGLAKLSKYFMNSDKQMIDMIYAGLEIGNGNESTGLYKSGNGNYYYGEFLIGTSIEDIILFFRSDENTELYGQMKAEIVEKEG